MRTLCCCIVVLEEAVGEVGTQNSLSNAAVARLAAARRDGIDLTVSPTWGAEELG